MGEDGKYPGSTDDLCRQLAKDWSTLIEPPTAHMQLNFTHLVGSYDARYYTYIWSLVMAFDLAEVFEEHGWMNKEKVMEYRKRVLEPGCMKGPEEMVEGFLGRKWSQGAFLKWLEG